MIGLPHKVQIGISDAAIRVWKFKIYPDRYWLQLLHLGRADERMTMFTTCLALKVSRTCRNEAKSMRLNNGENYGH